jgi:hypothetical protein
MKLSNTILFRVSFVAVLLGSAFAWALSAQEPAGSPRPPAPRWFTVHEYGIQVHVQPPRVGQKNWLLTVRDLGPVLPHLRVDLPPTAAQLRVAGKGKLHLQAQPNGDLQVAVPRHWVLSQAAPQVQLQVQSLSAPLLDCSIHSLFL